VEPVESRLFFYLIINFPEIMIVLFLCFGSSCGGSNSRPGETVKVYAGAGTMKVMEEIAPIFTRETGYKTDFEFASSGFLAKKITAGAPCDLYISASRHWTNYLVEKKLLDSPSIKPIAESELVCVVPKNRTHGGSTPGDLVRLRKIAVGDPAHVPAGAYARQTLSCLGLWDTLSLENKLVLTSTVIQALYLAEWGEVDAAIIYLGDAMLSDRIKIAFSFPENSHEPIEFIGAVVSASSSKPAARAFLDFLSTEHAEQVFTRYGFRLPQSILKVR
jgi:molybdate transport system substrate-binding protein